MVSEEYLKAAQDELSKLRGAYRGAELTRWAFIDFETREVKQSGNYVCVAGINNSKFWTDEKVGFAFAFNGESPKNSRADGCKLEGGPLSEKWLKFILGPESPFPDVLPHIDNIEDIEDINLNHGFIFGKDYLNVPAGQLRGFLIASRYAQEEHNRALNWSSLVELGVNPRIAWALTMNYSFGGGWLIKDERRAGHSVFYDSIGTYLPRLFKVKYLPDKPLKEVRVLSYCSDKLYTECGGTWTSAGSTKATLGVRIGMNVKEAEEEIIKNIEELYGDFPNG